MNFYDIAVEKIGGEKTSAREYEKKVLLIVNTASACGFTPQYDGLEALYKKYKDEGFVVLGFPCNQFANQEKGDNETIASFCSARGVSFPMFKKIDVKGPSQHELYRYLTAQAKGFLGGVLGKDVKWNFTKFLVSRDARKIKRFAPSFKPQKIAPYIEEFLKA